MEQPLIIETVSSISRWLCEPLCFRLMWESLVSDFPGNCLIVFIPQLGDQSSYNKNVEWGLSMSKYP